MRALPRRRRRSALAAAAAAIAASAAFAASIALPVSAAPSAAASTAIVEMTPALHDRIQRTVDAFLTKHDLPGVSVAVVTPDPAGPDPVITTFAAGVPTLGSLQPVDATTQFELGSETKIFTADLLAYLVASGRVSLDDPVQGFAPPGITVPEWIDSETGERTAITLGDLATHQAGLTDLPPNFQDGCHDDPECMNPRPGYTQSMLWDAFEEPCWTEQGQQRFCPLWKPGTKWLYSDWGFGLLGTIVSNVIDPVDESQPPAYQSALDQTFLDALGLSSTVLETPGDGRLATPYTAERKPAFHWNNTNAISGAGGLVSDATDMGAWVAAHLGYGASTAPLGVQAMADTLVPASSITIRCAVPGDCSADDFAMGLGGVLNAAEKDGVGVPWAFKDGATAGSSSDTALAASLGAGVTTMWNERRPDDDQNLGLAVSVLKLLIADETVPTAPPAEDGQAGAAPAALAESGSEASDLVVPAAAGAMLLAVGGILLVRRRAHR